MSVPYGQPPPAQPPGPSSSSGGLGLGQILALVTGGLGLVIYFLSFSDDVGLYLRTGLVGVLLLGGALLAAASVLPKAPGTLVPGAVVVVTGTLVLLIDVTNGPAFLGAAGGVALPTPGLVVVALLLAFLESAACVAALLAELGVLKMTPRPRAYPQPSWGPPPGGYPGGPVQGGYPGQQPVGPPSGATAQPPQQPYLPHISQYSPYSEQPAPYGGQPAQYGEPPPHYSEQPTRYSEQPAQYSEQPPKYGGQPGGSNQYGGPPPGTPPGAGTPPGGSGAQDKT